ncbi:MAG: class I SAM-dependent methyltransferase [Desulfobacterales bacterium]|nr:class I SAM-dependent methyltransferase [Desulfobacterales bacterium]
MFAVADTLKKNRKRWKTLPAGERRENVEYLMTLEDKEFYKLYLHYTKFWEKERGWEYEKYSETFSGRSVLEIGSGLGYDGIIYSNSAEKWVFCDIIPENLQFIQRIADYLNVTNVHFQLVEDVINHDFRYMFDGFYAHGVLHHVPFEVAQKEVANIDRFLKPGAKLIILMYPYERWDLCGKPPFDEFGCMTDGEGTPWAEYYDELKIQELFGNGYCLEDSIKWGDQNAEFVNFELIKR